MLRIIIRKPRGGAWIGSAGLAGGCRRLRAHGQGGYFVSASGVSAPPYGRQEPSEIVVEQLRCGIVVPMPSSSLATLVELPGLSAGRVRFKCSGSDGGFRNG